MHVRGRRQEPVRSRAAKPVRIPWVAAAAALAVVALLAPAGAGPARAQGPDRLDPRWLPWLGCWVPERAPGDEVPATEPVCVLPSPDGYGVAVVPAAAAEEPGSRPAWRADGARRPLEDGACRGWEDARWSADGARVFLRSELECPGGHRRAVYGILAILPGEVWLDVRAVSGGGETELSVRRLRPAAPEAVPDAAAFPGWRTAIETARSAASARLSRDDVVEAARRAPPEAVEALLLERGGRWAVDARDLETLAGAGVPGRITDLLVALSHPDLFAVDRVAGAITERTPVGGEGPGIASSSLDPWYPGSDPGRPWGLESGGHYGACGYRSAYDPFGRYRYDPFDPYGRWNYDRLGYSGGFGRCPPPAGGWIVRWPAGRPGGPVVEIRERYPDARVVRGRGYTRGRSGEAAPPGAAPAAGASADRAGTVSGRSGERGGSKGTVGRDGHGRDDDAPPPTRRAKKRGSGSDQG